VSPRTNSKTPKLSKLGEILRGINGSWMIVPQCSAESAAKLLYLKRGGRDFLQRGRDIDTAVSRFVDAEMSFEPSARPRKLLDAAARGAQSAVVLRFTAQQSIQLRPLTLEYLRRKIAKGLDRRVGLATRTLVQDLATCTWRIER
jgi:hypothetical protein